MLTQHARAKRIPWLLELFCKLSLQTEVEEVHLKLI